MQILADIGNTAVSYNGLGMTPQMGWSSWEAFHCDYNQTVIGNTATKMGDLGLKDLGYNYVIVDDCWQASTRNATGYIEASAEKFPDGMQALGDSLHKTGMKLGLYSSAGTKTCAGFPGSLDYEFNDAAVYAEWGVDYLKYDNCYNEGIAATVRYGTMSDALLASGREIFYSICNWGNEQVADWAHAVGNSWRTTQDINIYATTTNQWQQVVANFLQNQKTAVKAGKDHGWNDPDMLQIGLNVLTEAEEQTHFALWAFAKAPLIIGADLDTISNESLAILKNQYLIDINQDDYGQQAECMIGCLENSTETYHVYAGKFVNSTTHEGSLVALSVNWDDAKNATVALDLVSNGFANAQTDKCTTTDLWTGETNDHYAVPQSFPDIAPHGHVAKKIKCLPF